MVWLSSPTFAEILPVLFQVKGFRPRDLAFKKQ
jgi:hypothetical protein